MEDNYNISIPKPCQENWNEMKPDEQGRFCERCCKVVVDFTSKTKDEIVNFLLSAGKSKICGRAYGDQLSVVPVTASRQHERRQKLKFFIAALYFVFGSFLFTSCHSHKHTHAYGGDFLLEPKHPMKEKSNPLLIHSENKKESIHQ